MINSEKFDDREKQIIKEFKEASDPVLSAPEIAESLKMTRQGINNRLRDLQKRGVVDRKFIGSGAAWWLVDQQTC